MLTAAIVLLLLGIAPLVLALVLDIKDRAFKEPVSRPHKVQIAHQGYHRSWKKGTL